MGNEMDAFVFFSKQPTCSDHFKFYWVGDSVLYGVDLYFVFVLTVIVTTLKLDDAPPSNLN